MALVLGVVQGLTEFLPISSSGHLRLLSAAFGLAEPQTLFDVCVHAGTLGAVLAVFGREVLWVLRGLVAGLRQRTLVPGARMALLIVAATIPAAIVGIAVGGIMEARLTTPLIVSCLMIVNGFILMGGRGLGESGSTLEELEWRQAMLIGLAQSVALLRGISRSGTTITAALGLGVRRDAAASFSFLLSIPAIGGALLLELRHGMNGAPGALLVAGAITSAVSGYLALKVLLRVVNRGRLHLFAWYCWAVGCAGLTWVLLG